MASYLAPAGCIYRIDRDGQNWELLSNGYRNPYDAAFNRHGDLFTYDADMEWDLNTPWYRPTRVCLVSSGSEYGWRTGSGKWPAHHADGLASVADIGTGSPVGIVFGHETNFPAPWNDALFLADWSYGRVFALQLSPDGSGYSGQSELFMSGTPLPTTDMVVRPQDGALYFITGGRNVQSGLYRLSWTGTAEAAPVAANTNSSSASSDALRMLRHRMEAWHGRSAPEAVQAIWPMLGHADRFVRYAARVALEWQSVASWRVRALAETHPRRSLAALMALARVSARDDKHRADDAPAPDVALQAELLAALARFDWDSLDTSMQLELLRVHTLVFTRLGAPSESARATLVERFGAHFPSGSVQLDAELCELLVYLEDPDIAALAVPRLATAPTQEEQLNLARSLRRLTAGWTQPLAHSFGYWLQKAQSYGGGNSFAGYVRRVRDDAQEILPVAMQQALERGQADALIEAQNDPDAGAPPAISPFAGRTQVHDWTVEDLLPTVTAGLAGADLSRGRDLFAAAGCFTCHRVGGEGGSVGPDLTGAGGRFSVRDLLTASLEPSVTVSDQYARALLVLTDGSVVSGQIANLHGGTVDVIPDMSRPSEVVNIQSTRIERIGRSSVSPMPEGLLGPLTEDEVVDLMAWILSGFGAASEER
jgi:putative heme-binding domain-containing protein